MAKNEIPERQYWLWVTRPEHYLDENGNVREDLDPSKVSDVDGWWTCHKATRRGDLVFLWRSIFKKDIGYLIQAASNAYSIAEDEFASQHEWDYGCDYRVLYKFSPSINIQTLKNDSTLYEWSPLRQQFRRRVFRIQREDWIKLNRLIGKLQPTYSDFIDKIEQEPISKSILLEEQLEEALVNQLSLLNPFGYELELYQDLITGVTGRQYVCKGNGGRIDLLCYDKKNHQYVIIELKNVIAGLNTFGQICNYIGWLKDKIAKNIPVIGLVISRGYDVKFESAIKVPDCIFQLNLQDIGFT